VYKVLILDQIPALLQDVVFHFSPVCLVNVTMLITT